MFGNVKTDCRGRPRHGGPALSGNTDPGRRSDFSITMLAEEPRLAYDRVNLSKYFSGSSVEDLTLTTREFFDKNGIELHSGDPVAAIDRANKRVTTKSGAEYEYDILILATGSNPFVPPIPGRERPGVFVYRTIEDLEAISEAGKNSTRGVVIGGGLLGLEAAKALKDLGLTTHVVEFAPRLMAVQVDEGGGGLLRTRIEGAGRAGAHGQEHHEHRRWRSGKTPHGISRTVAFSRPTSS